MNKQINGIESQLSKIEETHERIQRELTRLADGTASQGVSKAELPETALQV